MDPVQGERRRRGAGAAASAAWTSARLSPQGGGAPCRAFLPPRAVGERRGRPDRARHRHADAAVRDGRSSPGPSSRSSPARRCSSSSAISRSEARWPRSASRTSERQFADFVAVQDSNFTVADGEFFVMLGPSGCGKTTTLRMIAGLELPTSGNILLGGEDVTFKRAAERDIAFVFQLFALYPHMNVRKNIGFPLKSQGMPRAEIRQRVEEAARLLRIDHILDRRSRGLAGGDRQRVALGRAIVRRPKVFLMDEPLGTLDTEFRDLMVRELRELHNRIGATTVYVTHDQLEAMAMADKIAVMNRGVIEQFATPQEIYDRPVSMFVADFIGSPPMNFLPVRAGLAQARASAARQRRDGRRAGAARGRAPRPSSRSASAPSTSASTMPRALRGSVFGAEYLGTTQIVTVTTEHGPVKARLPASMPCASRRDGRPRASAASGCRSSTGERAARIRTALARGSARMAEIALAGVTKRFGQPSPRSTRLDLTIADGEFVVLLGPTGAGKTTTLRLVAGLERPDAGRDPHRRPRRHRGRAGGARRGLRLPAILALSAPLRLRQPRLPAPLAGAPRAGGRDQQRVEEVAEMLRIAGQAAEPRDAAFRRRDAARRDRPRAGAPAGDLPDGRAALLARRQAPRRPAAGAEAHPAGSRRDHPLRHPRPDRGHDDGEPHRHHRARAG